MAIEERGVSAVNVGDLLAQNLQIPHYQRPYSWEQATALRLVDDITEALDDPERRHLPYVLGAVILHESGDRFDVVDGQQRLLTLRMILAIIDQGDPFIIVSDADQPVVRVWGALRRRLEPLRDEWSQLLDFVRLRCQVVRIVTDDVDEAFRVFDSQNYRGMPLAPHDLLKAHHLREMREESATAKAAVVEAWESVGDRELARLFSVYLYRIARWTRGESAPGFTVGDIDLWKGISPRRASTPSARYHLAAQAAIPMLSAWGAATSDADVRQVGRSRFQLDAPPMAGRQFFEMVTFMLAEVKRLAREAFDGDRGDFAVYDLDMLEEQDLLEERPSRGRYRYVAELYLAAVLYCTNKFGDDDLPEVSDRLFAWAYSLRTQMLRVQFRSVDNRAYKPSSAFVLLRNAGSVRVVHQLAAPAAGRQDNHEAKLAAILRGPGA